MRRRSIESAMIYARLTSAECASAPSAVLAHVTSSVTVTPLSTIDAPEIAAALLEAQNLASSQQEMDGTALPGLLPTDLRPQPPASTPSSRKGSL